MNRYNKNGRPWKKVSPASNMPFFGGASMVSRFVNMSVGGITSKLSISRLDLFNHEIFKMGKSTNPFLKIGGTKKKIRLDYFQGQKTRLRMVQVNRHDVIFGFSELKKPPP